MASDFRYKCLHSDSLTGAYALCTEWSDREFDSSLKRLKAISLQSDASRQPKHVCKDFPQRFRQLTAVETTLRGKPVWREKGGARRDLNDRWT